MPRIFQRALIILVTILGICAPAWAQTPAAKAPGSHVEAGKATVPDAKLRAYADATRTVSRMQKPDQPADPAKLDKVLRSKGLDLDEYNRITDAVRQDEALHQRLLGMLK